jgi:hypothetical protein
MQISWIVIGKGVLCRMTFFLALSSILRGEHQRETVSAVLHTHEPESCIVLKDSRLETERGCVK